MSLQFAGDTLARAWGGTDERTHTRPDRPAGGVGKSLVVFAAYVAVALGLGGSRLLDPFSTWVYIALVLGAAVLLALRALRRRRPPGAVARARAGAALWAAGELVYELAYSEAPELAPYPSVADAFWLGSYLAVGPGIVLVLRSRLRRAFHATMWLDAAIGATTIAALTATLAFDPVLADTAGYGWRSPPTSPIRSPTSACSRSSSRCSR